MVQSEMDSYIVGAAGPSIAKFLKNSYNNPIALMDEIPAALKGEILPHPELPIPLFLVVQLPPPPTTIVACIDILRKALAQDPTIQSICCPYSVASAGKRYPRYIVTIWTQLFHIYQLRQKWNGAIGNLEKRKRDAHLSSESGRLIDQVLDMIHRLPWSGSIHGFPLKVDITYLAEFLMTDWLSTSEVEVASEAAMFMSKVKSAYESQDSYRDSQSQEFRWVRKVGTALGNGEQKKLAIEVNVRDSHWVTIIIDCEKRVIWHGDSFHAAVDPELRVALKWWIHFTQETNTAFQGKPIIELLLGHVADERLKVFVKILERHEDQSFDAVSQSYEFTFEADAAATAPETTRSTRSSSPISTDAQSDAGSQDESPQRFSDSESDSDGDSDGAPAAGARNSIRQPLSTIRNRKVQACREKEKQSSSTPFALVSPALPHPSCLPHPVFNGLAPKAPAIRRLFVSKWTGKN
ncbi:hypothetical protein C8J56DRAFT_1022532 [Mycena floridula]|nr:hypothetical protein C8J56DRAFT_1022532 [Mycena floridula]